MLWALSRILILGQLRYDVCTRGDYKMERGIYYGGLRTGVHEHSRTSLI